eukprot:NODE_4978_length_624_cov_192.609842.p1 GENE.NODE_4978_length_624_cov_192.609842~~NODE_4978_length_624_cov_192.609842.p1  ORF type:complete len:107 (+),score=20.19 NODE_4978_length_624_cov_192.609842:78-398(+)
MQCIVHHLPRAPTALPVPSRSMVGLALPRAANDFARSMRRRAHSSVSIDEQTQVPEDVYESFALAGADVRSGRRGNHALVVKDINGFERASLKHMNPAECDETFVC